MIGWRVDLNAGKRWSGLIHEKVDLELSAGTGYSSSYWGPGVAGFDQVNIKLAAPVRVTGVDSSRGFRVIPFIQLDWAGNTRGRMPPLPGFPESPAMLKMIFLLARRMFIRLLLVLLPLGLFMFLAQAIPLSPLQSLLVLVPVIAFEVWLVIRHLLPVMGELVTKTLYSSNITTDEEVLVEASRRMLNSGDPQGALELLERYRKENPGLVRSWLMESSLLNDMRRYADSVNVLQKGLEYGGWRKEDRALFLYKIGAIYDSQLHDPDRARKYWEEAADKYPDTAYGRSALDKL